MRKILSALLLAGMMLGLSAAANAQNSFRKARISRNSLESKMKVSRPLADDTRQTVALPYVLAAYYAEDLTNANYYMLLSTEEGSFDSQSGEVQSTGWVLCLDLYSTFSSPIELPEGEYESRTDCSSFSYNPDYSYMIVYNEQGEQVEACELDGTVTVEKDTKGQLLVTANVVRGGVTYRLVFNGSVRFTNTNQSTNVFAPIDHDVEGAFTGAKAFYNGNLYQANTGNMMLELYDTSFDAETGSLTAKGHMLQLFLFSTLFKNSASAVVNPGTYTMARSFARDTWYPGLEIDYMGMTIPFGTLIYNRYGDAAGEEAYGYINAGTVTIEKDADGLYLVTANCMTENGYVVNVTYHGEIPVEDISDDTPVSFISTLEQDYELSLDHIELAHIWRVGETNGCGDFVVDLGSPSGRDQFVTDHAGDIMRLEFLTEPKEAYLPSMIYNVMEEKWDTYYAPGRMVKGHFQEGGDLSGTRWQHFAEGRYYIMDGHAPADAGDVSVDCDEETGNYTFIINLLDDAGFRITGRWTGPVELMYDPEKVTGISPLESAKTKLAVSLLNNTTLLLGGVAAADNIRLYSASGALVANAQGCSSINIGQLPAGVYVVSVAGKEPVKIIKR